MQTSFGILLRRQLTVLALKGYGWKRRKQRRDVSYRIEWQDPSSGHWYTEKTAFRLLKSSLLAEYDKANPGGGNYHIHF
ncbi:hypothetical protein [Methylomagnum sp.]